MTTSKILSDFHYTLGTARKSDVKIAYRLSDDGGTIQAVDMLQLTSDPSKHMTTALTTALLMLGCKKSE